jgi:hypothetical protein
VAPPTPAPDAGRAEVTDRTGEVDRRVARGLAGYVRAVASALQVGVEATHSEVSDTATAYIALARRSPQRPGQDLMLVWSELDGWALEIETAPAEQPATLARLDADPVAEPQVVATFVREVLAGDGPRHHPKGADRAIDRAALGSLLARYGPGRR